MHGPSRFRTRPAKRVCPAAALGIAALVLMTAPVYSGSVAHTIYVDFGTDSGSASGLVGGGAATWNALGTSQYARDYGQLVNDAGAPGGVWLKYGAGFNNAYTSGGAWNDPSVPWSVGAATSDGLRLNTWTSPRKVTLYNIPAGQTLKISLLTSTTENNSWQDQDYITNGQDAGVYADNGSNEFNAYSHGWVNRKIMVWESVLPDAGGEIELTGVATRNDFWLVNAIKIEVIEPPPKGTVVRIR